MKNYLERMAELLEVDQVSVDDVLEDFECWDSLTVLSIIAYLDEAFKVTLSAEQVCQCRTVGELHTRYAGV
ncbi:MAG: acyl carrier protein [Curvibacter sp.]|nr:MAG: acyl carrier protein [Curvibacter sp.]